MGYETPIVSPPNDYNGDFFKGKLKKKKNKGQVSLYLIFLKIISDIADGLVGVGLITQNEDMPGMLTMDKGYNDMSKFLNRILGMPVNLQNLLFKYFTDTLNSIIDSVSSFLEIFIFTIFLIYFVY